MNNLKIFFVVSSIFFWCCQSNKNSTINGNLITIDITKDYPLKKVDIDKIADREFIPLETNDDVLFGMGAKLNCVSEKYILVTDFSRGDIFIFTRNGKIVTHLNRKGGGPEEYSTISSVVFDEKNEEIFVFDFYMLRQILVYSLTGSYKRLVKYSDDFIFTSAYNFDDETMLVYDTKGVDFHDRDYNRKPYMFMSKKNGNITSVLNINLKERYSTKVFDRFTDDSGKIWTQSFSFFVPNKLNDGRGFVISDVSSDTIYRLNENRDLIPFIVSTPSVHSTDPHVICTCLTITDKFIILYITTLDYVALVKGKSPASKTLMYEFETNTMYSVDYKNTVHETLQKNIDASLAPAHWFTRLYKENKLSGELKQLAATIDEEDNPVVVIEKYK